MKILNEMRQLLKSWRTHELHNYCSLQPARIRHSEGSRIPEALQIKRYIQASGLC